MQQLPFAELPGLIPSPRVSRENRKEIGLNASVVDERRGPRRSPNVNMAGEARSPCSSARRVSARQFRVILPRGHAKPLDVSSILLLLIMAQANGTEIVGQRNRRLGTREITQKVKRKSRNHTSSHLYEEIG